MASTSGRIESEPATTSQGVPQSSSSSSPSSSRSLLSCCLFPSRRSAESTESKPATVSQAMAPSSSSCSPSSSRSLFSCCSISSWRSMESNSMASTSNTTGCILQNEGFQEMAAPVTTSSTTGCIPQNEAFQERAPPASTSGTSGCIPENEVMGASQEMTPSTSTSGIPQNQIIGAPQEMASPASTSGIPQNEAFQGMAPSASDMFRSSTLIQKPRYDVFINHRGPDVKETLATRIYNILCDMKVPTFLDSEELDYGDFFPETLQAAIRGATLHIAIFSKRYAESAWCLEELSLMLRSGAKIIPIFYHVDPTDLRYVDRRGGVYGPAFNKHEETHRYKPEKLEEWKDALHKVSFCTGEIINNDDDEMRLFKNIVNIVLKEISNVPLVVAKHPVGLNEIIKDFEKILQFAGGDQGVQIVGIWGMGGSGKTTLAKELFNQRSSSMERSSFIFDIREAKGLLQKKQSELLKGLGVNETIDSVEQGQAILARHLRSFRVLIVMDDVDHVDQLDALLPAKDGLLKDNLGKGSLIIVTTREHQVLTSWGISSIYKIRALDPFNARQLFCWHAFLQPYPLDEFQDLVENFIKVCDGLPLSLKVFGAQLYGKSSKQFWLSLFNKISRILPKDIKERLKISYDALDNEEKNAFLDIACFFIGEENSLAIEVWDGSEGSGLYTWKILLNKCLVEVDHNNCIRMHDHLRDLGREIANQHSPSRIWLPKHIMDFGKQIKKRNNIRGIKVSKDGIKELLSYREALTPYLVGLKLLVIEGDYSSREIGEVLTELVWLRWSHFGQRNLTGLSLKNLRVLELNGSGCLEELWEAESDAPVQLRELIISTCPKFQGFPNSIGYLHELKKIVFEGYKTNVESLPEQFCRLQLLEHLVLEDCGKLSSLPSNFGNLTNLRYLDLTSCHKLRRLPDSFKNLTLLRYLSFYGCSELILEADDFQKITELEFLSLRGCDKVKELPRHITNQASLKELYLGILKELRELPTEIGQLGRLQTLDIACDLLISLPNSLGDLSSLTRLKIRVCYNLESLPTSLGYLSSLTHLTISRCPKVKCLQFSVGRLSRLEDLKISSCPIIQVDFEAAPSSSALSNLKRVKITETEVCSISISDRYPQLESLELHDNNHLTEIKALPVKLECLDIVGSPKLVELPSFARLTSLRQFELRGCDRIEKIEGLKYCTRLEILKLRTCWEVPGIENLEQMERLKRVEVRANKGSAIVSCIEKIQKWPDELIICTRAVPHVSTLLDSFKIRLSPNLSATEPAVLPYHSSSSFVIYILEKDPVSMLGGDTGTFKMEIGEGKWALVVLFTQRSKWLDAGILSVRKMIAARVRAVRSLSVSGEGQKLVEAFLPLLQNIL